MRISIIFIFCLCIASCQKQNDSVDTNTSAQTSTTNKVIGDTTEQIKIASVSYYGVYSCSGNATPDAVVLVTYSSIAGKDSTISFKSEWFKSTFNVNPINEYNSAISKESWHYILKKDSLKATYYRTCGEDIDICEFKGTRK